MTTTIHQPPKETTTMEAITSHVVYALRSTSQVIQYNFRFTDIRELNRAFDEASDPAQHAAINTLIEQHQLDLHKACGLLLEELQEAGVNVESACGDDGDYNIHLVTAENTYEIAGGTI
jgi:hypothetical protein